MRVLRAIRYVTPLREGGSMPAIVEADDASLYVLKFRGAGQGPKALVAEWLVGELARACGFHVPEIVGLEVDNALGRNEPDPEIRDLLRASHGLNLGLRYLPGAITYDPAAPPQPDAALASALVWFDAFTMNVDRSPRNPNLLWFEHALWLIDHGAALYPHHAWASAASAQNSTFAPVRDHVLLPLASELEAQGARLRATIEALDLAALTAALPDAWLVADNTVGDAGALRTAYEVFLRARLQAAPRFTEEAARARTLLV